MHLPKCGLSPIFERAQLKQHPLKREKHIFFCFFNMLHTYLLTCALHITHTPSKGSSVQGVISERKKLHFKGREINLG